MMVEVMAQLPLKNSLYYSGEYYDSIVGCASDDFNKKNIAFWIGIAKKHCPMGSRVLELACGTGRVTIPLAQKGFNAVGIDNSESMLNLARKKALEFANVEFKQGDIKNFESESKFSMIFLAEDGFGQLLDIEQIESCLACIKDSLEPNGIFVIDVLHPNAEYLSSLWSLSNRDISAIFDDPNSEGIVTVSRARMYDFITQTVSMKLFFKLPIYEQEIVEEHRLRIFFPMEMEVLLKYNGFTIKEKIGDYDMNPFGVISSQQILICQVNS
jgi:SAM-dependent methyltransferase